MSDPTDSGAPAPIMSNRGDLAGASSVDDPLMQWADAAYRAERAAVLAERQRRAAGLELAYRHGRLEHSERWERALCNQLAAEGWDVEYLARRYGIRPKEVAA